MKIVLQDTCSFLISNFIVLKRDFKKVVFFPFSMKKHYDKIPFNK